MARGGLNKVMIIGRLGNDPELKYTPQGQAVCSMTLATDESYKGKDGNMVNQVEWHRIVLWRFLAENAGKYLKKGSQVYIEGKLQTRMWEKDNQKHYTTEIVASEMTFLGGKSEGGQQQDKPNQNQQNPTYQQQSHQPSQQQPQANQAPSYDIPDTNFNDDDLPF